MKAHNKLGVITFLIFLGYMQIGIVIHQTVTAISNYLIPYWFFLPIYFFSVICSAVFGRALAIGIKGVCNEKTSMKMKRQAGD